MAWGGRCGFTGGRVAGGSSRSSRSVASRGGGRWSRCVTASGVAGVAGLPGCAGSAAVRRAGYGTDGCIRGSIGGLFPPRARGPPMLPAATLPAARYYVTPARRRRAGGRGRPGPRREARRGKEPARDAAAGLAEVMAMPAIWKDAAGNLLELPGPGRGIVVCGALPGAAAPGPGGVRGELAAAGVPASPGPVREGTGLGLVTSVTGPALIGEALARTPAPRG